MSEDRFQKNPSAVDHSLESPVTAGREDRLVDERQLLSKLDYHILPAITVMYIFTFLDRVMNIGNAVVFGLEKDLHLTGQDYNVALCIFFVPYIIFEIPANMMMHYIKPTWTLTGSMFLFGIVTLCQGFVHSYSALLACRFLLGLLEAGFFPGALYLLAMWYRREESQKRFSFFFLGTAIAGAFGGLLASGIGHLDGRNGWLAWRWIFIIEGSMTCVIAIICIFFQPNFPEDVQWLSETEREAVRRRLSEDAGPPIHEKMSKKLVLEVMTDIKVLAGGLMYLGFMVSAYGYSYFAPTIIASFGYGPIETNLHSIPVWAVAFVVAMAFAVVSDRLRQRYFMILIAIAIALIGYCMLLGIHHHTKVQYGALFIAIMGTLAAMPIALCWFGTNFVGHTRRAIGTAWQSSAGNIGGIIATFIYRTKDSPDFIPGYAVTVGFLGVALISSTVYYVAVSRENAKIQMDAENSTENTSEGKLAVKLYT